jgi:hypothetical protein
LKESIKAAGRPDGLAAARMIGLALVLLAIRPSGRLAGQGVLNEFSYDNLRLSGIQVDAGVLGASDLMGATVGGIRFDYGRIAPKVRLMFGLSYFKTQYGNEATARFERRLDSLVNPSTPDTINLGQIGLSDLIGDVDFQYVFPQGRGINAYVGTGISIHVRNGSGAAIDGTFVDDALDVITAGLNGTIGFDFSLSQAWRFTLEGRGVLSTGLRTASLRTGIMYRLKAGRQKPAATSPPPASPPK